jgi:UrcA family protein
MNNSSNYKKSPIVSLIAASVAVLACAAGASGACADEVSQPRTKVVGYSDLNLDSASGASAFYQRIRAAARDVCSSYDGRDAKENALRQHCFDSAVAGSVSQVNRATVTAIHHQSVGRVS